MNNAAIDKLLTDHGDELDRLRKIVKDTMAEEKLIVNNLLNPPKETLTRGQSISDKVARFGGSWNFIIIFAVILFVWIMINSIMPADAKFDPYPFILMNLIF